MMPKKLNSATRSMSVLLIFKDGMLKCLCGIWNTINFDFEIIMDNIFNLSQLLILDNSKFTLTLKLKLSDISRVVIKVLSSA